MRKRLLYYIRKIKKAVKVMPAAKKRLFLVGIMALVLGSVLGNYMGRSSEEKFWREKLQKVTAEITEEERTKAEAVQRQLDSLKNEMETEDEVAERPWYLTLVNWEYPMEEGYVPELTDLQPGYSVDSRIAEAARKMLADAEEEGLNIIICSAYRSVERQEQVFNSSMQDRLNQGMDYWDAYKDTSLSVAEPGTSEHAMGLALDLISNQYTGLDKKQEETAEAKWLAANCHKYGFILRYPPEKTDITGIIYEPWHYRYVGVEDATRIKELNITLEEYLEEYY